MNKILSGSIIAIIFAIQSLAIYVLAEDSVGFVLTLNGVLEKKQANKTIPLKRYDKLFNNDIITLKHGIATIILNSGNKKTKEILKVGETKKISVKETNPLMKIAYNGVNSLLDNFNETRPGAVKGVEFITVILPGNDDKVLSTTPSFLWKDSQVPQSYYKLTIKDINNQLILDKNYTKQDVSKLISYPEDKNPLEPGKTYKLCVEDSCIQFETATKEEMQQADNELKELLSDDKTEEIINKSGYFIDKGYMHEAKDLLINEYLNNPSGEDSDFIKKSLGVMNIDVHEIKKP